MYKTLLAIGMALPYLAFSQQFQQAFGGEGFDIITDVIQLEDQSYISFGVTTSFEGASLGMITHHDGMGNLVTSQSIQLMNGTEIHDVEVTESGTIYFVGAYASDVVGNAECLYGEITLAGEVIWTKSIASPGVESGYSMTLNDNGGFTFVILGNGFSSSGAFNPSVVQVDGDGNTLWSTAIEIEGYARPTDILQNDDGSIMIYGHHDFELGNGHDPMLMKLSADGEVQWIKEYQAPGNDLGWRIMKTENGYLIGGDTNSFGEGLNDIYLLEVDQNGNPISQNTYGGSGHDHLSSISQGKADKLIIGGTTSSFGGGQLDMMAMELEADGSVSWSKAYGGEEKEVGHSVLATPDGGYLFGGYTRSFAENFYQDGYLVKTNERGDCYCNSFWDQLLIKNPCEFIVGQIEWGQSDISSSEDAQAQTVTIEFPVIQTLCSFGELIDGSSIGEENSGDMTLSLDEPAEEIVNLVPIPASGSLQIEVIQYSPANLSVYTVSGKMVQNVAVKGVGRQILDVKVPSLSQGLYLVSLVDAKSTHTKKVFIN